jgi:hypothetical protein
MAKSMDSFLKTGFERYPHQEHTIIHLLIMKEVQKKEKDLVKK